MKKSDKLCLQAFTYVNNSFQAPLNFISENLNGETLNEADLTHNASPKHGANLINI